MSDDGRRVGTVLETTGGVYRVRFADGETVEASLRGRLKHGGDAEDRVVVGDRVSVALEDGDDFVVEGVEPRRNRLIRGGGGGRVPKVIAANLDGLVIVESVVDPPPQREVLDRLLVLAEHSGIEPILVFNKIDRLEESPGPDIDSLYEELGYRVLRTSARSGEGIDRLHDLLCGHRTALVGPSGVGKSSLLNRVDPALELSTGALSRKTGRGKHTTVSARLIPLSCGGEVADTPGFTEVGLWEMDSGEIGPCFPEIRSRMDDCKFRSCSHVHEPKCAVREAVDAGDIDADRYANYLRFVADSEG